MPYALDEVPVSDDILDPHRVLAWARRKPRDCGYFYYSGQWCALFQYLKESGAPVEEVRATDWVDPEGTSYPLAGMLNNAVLQWPHTFGAFADRLEAALK